MTTATPKTTAHPPETNHREDLVSPEINISVGSLGSAVVAISGGTPNVFDAITASCSDRYRRGWQDLRAGLAVFMAPSGPHEGRTKDATGLIHALADAMQIPLAALGARAVEVGGTKANPDDSFLLGDLAVEYLKHQRAEGTLAADEWFDSTHLPPDLVVEVEHTHHNAGKQRIYRNAGVSELWEPSTDKGGRLPKIIALDGSQGPFEMTESHLLPGVRPECLIDALRLLHRIGGYGRFMARIERGDDVVRQFLGTATGVANEDNNDAGGSPASP